MLRVSLSVVLLLLVLYTSGTVEGGCPSQWKENQGHCYRFFTNKLNWIEAQMACRRNNANLVQVDNASENLWLSKNFQADRIWLGGTDLGTEGKWRWIESGEEMKYKNWFQNEPNNEGNKENCLHFKFAAYREQWNDVDCSYKYTFICEKSASSCN